MRASLALGFVGLFASLGTGFGEYLLHYSAAGYHNPAPYQFFTTISEAHVTAGHFIAILCLPFYVGGYVYLYQRLEGGNTFLRRACLAMGIYGLVVGGIWLGSRAYLHAAATASAATASSAVLAQLLQRHAFLNESLIGVTRTAILVSSICQILLVLSGKTSLPKWVAAVNPIGLVIFALGLFLWLPAIGNHVMPVAMNFAHAVLFGVLILLQMKEQRILNQLSAEIR